MLAFFSFHYIVFNFQSKNNAFEELAVMATQNKLKGCHGTVFSWDSKGLFNMQILSFGSLNMQAMFLIC